MRVLVACEYSGKVREAFRRTPSADRWKIRSETFQGIADAMAAQWSLSPVAPIQPDLFW